MKLKKWKSVSGKNVREEIDLCCTEEEFEMLREFLKPIGVRLDFSMRGCGEVTAYVRNPYKQAVDGWGSDQVKALAKEFEKSRY